MDIDNLSKTLDETGQSHLLQHWKSLSVQKQLTFFDELTSLDYTSINEYFSESMRSCDHGKLDDVIKPVPAEVCGDPSTCSSNLLQSYRESGYKAISSGQVACILLAGGHGTRLGVSYPKGMYDVGLASEKTLYQIQIERILRIQSVSEQATGQYGSIAWYIMTSEHTKAPTQTFFEKHKYFGLDPENVVLFEQSQLPALTLDGKIILSEGGKVALSPDGNGGLYKALGKEGILEDMKQRGIKHIYVYCVDNILVHVADPEFLGFCIQRNTDCATVVVEKHDPKESVGVVCKVNGVYQVVEYSEITHKTAERRNEDGTLTFCHGNICNHYCSLAFLESCVTCHEKALQHHIAKKKVPYITEDGTIISPTVPNAIKMEKFVFDVFQFATNFGVWIIQRENGFSPLKNADGAAKDTPTTCREALYALHVKYVTKAGGKIVSKDGTPWSADLCNGHINGNKPEIICEISPLVSYAGENLEDICKDKLFTSPLVIDLDSRGNVTVRQGTPNDG